MNEKVTNLTPNATTKSPHDYENRFNEQFYIVEGASGLLFHVAAHDGLNCINDSVNASTTYAIQKAADGMNEVFYELLERNMYLQKKLQEKDAATKTNIIDDDLSPNIKKHGSECEFNHQHLIAEGAAGLLFSASSNPQKSMNNPVINSAAYSIESAVREMNKCFQALLANRKRDVTT